eukprot:g4328.t1
MMRAAMMNDMMTIRELFDEDEDVDDREKTANIVDAIRPIGYWELRDRFTWKQPPNKRCLKRDHFANNTTQVERHISSTSPPLIPSTFALSALHLAAAFGHVRVCAFLVDRYGAYVDVRASEGQTPLHMANNSSVAKILIRNGADVNAICIGKTRPLHVASDEGVIDVLVKEGAKIDARTSGGCLPLHYAMSPAAVNALVRHCSDVSAFSAYGHSPLHLCVSHGLWRVALRLLCYGAKIDAKASGRYTQSMTPMETLQATLTMLSRTSPKRRKEWNVQGLRRCLFVLDLWRRSEAVHATLQKSSSYARKARMARADPTWLRRWGSVVPCALVLRDVEQRLIFGCFCGVLRTVSKNPVRDLVRATRIPRVHVIRVLLDFVGAGGFHTDDDTEAARKERRLPRCLQIILKPIFDAMEEQANSRRDVATRTARRRRRRADDADGGGCAVM